MGQTVAILLCSFQGERWLPEQLESLRAQTHGDWTLTVSDDGSTDATAQIVRDFAARVPQPVRLTQGPQRGHAANFLALTASLAHAAPAPYYAWCDQDDVWYPDHLARALDALRAQDAARPALYCSRTRWVSEDGQTMGLSPDWQRPAGFRHALAQCLAGGNTMVFNEAARQLLLRTGAAEVSSHDWWLYLLVTGCGGQLVFDRTPGLDYRQHPHNLMGHNRGWRAQWARARKLLQGEYGRWVVENLHALHTRARDWLTAENARLLDAARQWQAPSLRARWQGWRQSGAYRQTALGQLGLLFAVLSGSFSQTTRGEHG
ncbi:MAG: glycosyltransferase [Rhodocyclaceae bacterium]|nr:glycosyltransferase [Rhodocyclaceae bacterium]